MNGIVCNLDTIPKKRQAANLSLKGLDGCGQFQTIMNSFEIRVTNKKNIGKYQNVKYMDIFFHFCQFTWNE